MYLHIKKQVICIRNVKQEFGEDITYDLFIVRDTFLVAVKPYLELILPQALQEKLPIGGAMSGWWHTLILYAGVLNQA